MLQHHHLHLARTYNYHQLQTDQYHRFHHKMLRLVYCLSLQLKINIKDAQATFHLEHWLGIIGHLQHCLFKNKKTSTTFPSARFVESSCLTSKIQRGGPY